jgi:hypothetical protein
LDNCEILLLMRNELKRDIYCECCCNCEAWLQWENERFSNA